MLRRCTAVLAETWAGEGKGNAFRVGAPIPEMPEEQQDRLRPQLQAQERHTIGWVGLGDMGMSMAWKLIKDPQHSVHIWNRNERKLRAYAKHVEEETQRFVHQRPLLVDIPRFADVIFVSLANIRAVREVLLENDDALVYNARPGTVIVDHSTVDPATTEEIAHIARLRDVHYLDAPVAGSPELTTTGSLSVMVGGNELAFRRVARMMTKYAHCVEYMGESGAGTRMKVLHEAAAAVQAVASAETALLARSLGLQNLDTVGRVMDASLGGSNMFRRNAGYFPEQFVTRTKIATGSSVSRYAKNMSILDKHVTEAGLTNFLPYTTAAKRIINDVGDAGGHDADISSVLHFLNPQEHNSTVHWEVPVTDVAANESLRAHLANEAEPQAETPWSHIDEFTESHAPVGFDEPSGGAPPRIDPSRLEDLYSKAKPRMAATLTENLAGQTIPKSKFQPWLPMENLEDQSPTIRNSMTRFKNISEVVDQTFGKTSFNGVPLHQRTPTLVNPGQRDLFDGEDTSPAPAASTA